ncbi:hypothetical protein TTRE_0000289501 [Trichuris trichiura]|uniref:Uncharacterized protein n=1 Tax=Trichuris trichiura TaxID=36087 RepID=A0A077Z7H4_TRITR|nr:hypothetical protein TTRE_0000289501 [Trichuris trichiura]
MLSAADKEDTVGSSVCDQKGPTTIDRASCWPQSDWYQGRESNPSTYSVSLYQPFTNGRADDQTGNLFIGSVACGEPVSVIRYTGSKWNDSAPIDAVTQQKEICSESLFQTDSRVPISACDPALVVAPSERADGQHCDVGLPADSWNLLPFAQCRDTSTLDSIEVKRLLSAGVAPLRNFSKVLDHSLPAVLNCQSSSARSCSAYQTSKGYAVSTVGSCGIPFAQVSADSSFANVSETLPFPHLRAHFQQVSMPSNVNALPLPAGSFSRSADNSVGACLLQPLQSTLKGSDGEHEEAVFSNSLPFEDQIRFRKRDYFGMPVNLSVLSKSDCTGQVIYSITTSCSRSMTKRKNKNPLATKFTVRNLKQLLQCQEAALRTSKYQVHMDGSSMSGQPAFILGNANGRRQTSAIPLFPAAGPIHAASAESYDRSFLQGVAASSSLVGGPFTANSIEHIEQKSAKSIRRPQRPRFFDFETLEIGHFVVSRTTSASVCGNKLRLYFSKQQMIYDFEWSNGALLLKQFVAIVVRFGSIIGMRFQGDSIIIAVSEPPRCVLSSGKSSPIKRHCDNNCDITNGELTNSFVHKITLCRAQALVVQNLLLQHDSEMERLLFHFQLGYGAVYDHNGERCSFADHWLLNKEMQENVTASASLAPIVGQENCSLDSEAPVKLEGIALEPVASSDPKGSSHF